MKPVSNVNFGNVVGNLKITYNSGAGSIDGYVVKQTGTSRYVVAPLANGTTQATVTLATTTAEASALPAGKATITGSVFGANTVEHVSVLRGMTCVTTEGHTYSWGLGTAQFPGQIGLSKI